MTNDKKQWLNQVIEDAIEPGLPICDAHHHLWDRPDSRYMAQDLFEDTAAHNVVSTVFVECMSEYRTEGPEEMQPVGETEFVERAASEVTADCSMAAAIISYADLRFGDAIQPVLDAHRAASPTRFRGIRHACGWDPTGEIRNSHTKPPEGLLLDPKFREGFACLEKNDLVFDAWLYHTQLEELTSLARAFPGTTIVLDHFGGPLGIGRFAGQRDEVFEIWKTRITELAACPNIVMKLGGLAMPINGFEWHKRPTPPTSQELAEATAPYYLFTIDQFGPQQCMFESNFPVDKTSCSYTVLWNSFKRIVADFSDDEKAALFHDTAARAYTLE